MPAYRQFQVVGEWSLDERLKSGVRFRVRELADTRVIYAFRVNGEVKYVGICDGPSTTLKSRMERYQYIAGQDTNKRIAKLIKEHLGAGHDVTILAWRPDSELKFQGLMIDLVRGLEYPLLERLHPDWNSTGKRSTASAPLQKASPREMP